MESRRIPRKKMPLSERAKIFVPFEPLKGFREALEERERQALEQACELAPLEDDEPDIRPGT